MYGTTVVSLEHARKSFGDAAVLKDISLSVNHGEVMAVIGRRAAASQRCCGA